MAWLGTRYRVRFDPGLFSRDGFLAGDDARRAAELNAALEEPDTRAIIAARGGYGMTRILPHLKLEALARAPKWLVGFSDFTALHVEAQALGIMTLHAHNVAGLGRGHSQTRALWSSAIEHPELPRCFEALSVYNAGTARGCLWGGNLTVLFTCLASGRLKPPRGAVLLLEDVAETSYRIDRMLTALLQ